MQRVLGIDVSPDLLASWRNWFAPPVQPFPAHRLSAGQRDRLPEQPERLPTPEVRDTFYMYAGSWVWFDRPAYAGLDQDIRETLLRTRPATGRSSALSPSERDALDHPVGFGNRFAWWPQLLECVGDGPVLRYVVSGVRPSRHREVRRRTWHRATRVLPAAEALAGSYAERSGPNCFGTVLAAAGVAEAADGWIVQDQFESWLTSRAEPVRDHGSDDTAGTVLVWRDDQGEVSHAAVTIGDGYALSKPSQAWCSPRVVWTVAETVYASRLAGRSLHRYTIG